MPTPIPPDRLPGLKTALQGYTDADWLSQRDVGRLYGVSPSRMVALIKTRFQAFPAGERRDDATMWYPARKAVQAMIAYMEGTGAEKRARAARQAEIMTGVVAAKEEATQAAEAAAAAPPPMTASDYDRMASAQTRVWKLRKEQGLYVSRDEMQATARQVNSLFVRGVTSVATRIDPNGELPPLMRAAMERALREIVLEIHDAMAEMMGADEPVDERPAAGGRSSARRQR